jgi:signal transduction histidine kinase
VKLISEKNIYIFAAYLIIFTIVGLLFYFTLYTVIYLDYNKKLQIRKQYVIKQLNESDSLLTYSKFSGNTLSISRKTGPAAQQKDIFSDTVIYDEIDNRFMKFRQLKFDIMTNGKNYNVIVRRSVIETEGIIQGLVVVILIIFIILLLILLCVNHWISNKVWTPFFKILEEIKKYEPGKILKLDFPHTNIKEFNELTGVVVRLMDKISEDFLALKEFTENISHEVQTPLSIIKSKLELLLQSENLSENEVDLVNKSYQSLNKLSKLTEALSLLIKIDNYQFSDFKNIDLTNLFLTKYDLYNELLEMKEISLEKKIQDHFVCTMDPTLADILVENIVSNSIKHNQPNGKITLDISTSEICVYNTGKELLIDPEKLFQRFVKSNSQSLGLGLSIVNTICSINHLKVEYTFNKPLHKISISKMPIRAGTEKELVETKEFKYLKS